MIDVLTSRFKSIVRHLPTLNITMFNVQKAEISINCAYTQSASFIEIPAETRGESKIHQQTRLCLFGLCWGGRQKDLVLGSVHMHL